MAVQRAHACPARLGSARASAEGAAWRLPVLAACVRAGAAPTGHTCALPALPPAQVSFHARYNASGPEEAINVADLVYYVLGSFSTVDEVRRYLDPARLQITTRIIPPGVRSVLTEVFASDPDIPA